MLLAWRSMGTGPEPSTGRVPYSAGTAAFVSAGLVAAALLAAAFAGDGSGFDGVLPVGGLAVGLLAAYLLVFAFGAISLPRIGTSGGVLLVTTGLLVVWTGASVAWSIVPDRSWDTFNRSVVFAAFLGLGVVLAGVGRDLAARLAAAALALVTGVVLSWALLAKAVPSLDPGGERIARLREPVGYWNALALLADVAIVLALWLGATSGRRVSVRILGGLLGYVAVLALLLTISRAGVLAAIGVVVLWLVCSRERIEGGLLLVAAGVPAGLVAGWAFTRPALVDGGASHSDRVADGAVFGVGVLVGACVVAALVGFGARRSLDERLRRRTGRGLLVAMGAVAAAGVVALAVAIGNPVSWFDEEVAGPSCAEVVNDPSRFGSLNFNNRWCWWGEARDVAAHHAPLGAGAGSFEVARKRFRTDGRSVLQPHSVPLQHLSDGGIVGLAIFLAFVLSAGWACVGALRRLDGAERAAAVALVAAPAAYLVHALADYTWDFLAVTAPTMVALGVLVGAGRPALTRRRRPLVGLASLLVALAVVASFASPRLAERSVRASTRALDEGDFALARDRANRAHLLNPLSVAPLHAQARISERRGFGHSAQTYYIQAVELQPENPETWYALGLFEYEVRENMCNAYRFLNDAYTLDPAGGQWVQGGPLDVARDAVNAGACEPA